MSLFANQEEIEKTLSKIFSSSKEKSINDFISKFDKYKQEISSLNINWGDILIKKNNYINQNPIFFFKLYNKLQELNIQHFKPYTDLLFDKLFASNLDTQLKISSLTYITSSSMDLSSNKKEKIFNILQIILFDNIIIDELNSSPYEILSNIINHFNCIVPFQVDFIIETIIILAYYFYVERNEPQSIATLTIGNILRPSGTEKITQINQNIYLILKVFQNYLLYFNGIKRSEILKLILSFLLLEYEISFLKEYYCNYSEQFTKVIYYILISNDEFINVDNLNCKSSHLFYFALNDNMYDSLYKTKIDNYIKTFNVFIMKRKEKLRLKIQKEKVIINMLKCMKNIIEDASIINQNKSTLNEFSLYVKIPFANMLNTIDEVLLKKSMYLKDIIFYIQALVTHYGKELIDEWEIIFKILKQIIEIKSIFTDIEKIQTIEYILSQIYSLYLYQYFNGNIKQLKDLLNYFPKLNEENLNLFKIKCSLDTKDKFITNIENVIREYFIPNSEHNYSVYLKNHLLEIIRYNYVFSIKANSHYDIALKIEDSVKNNFQYLADIKNTNNLIYISYCLSEMLFYTKNISFFKNIITSLFSLPFEYKKDSYNIYHTLLIDTIRTVIMKLNNSFQKEKLSYLIKLIFNRKKMDSIIYFRTALKIISHIIINKDLFVHFAYNKNYSNTKTTFPCCLIFDYNHKKIKEQKSKFKTKEEYAEFKNKYYSPFIAFNFEKIFTFFTTEFNKNNQYIAKSNNILYEIFEFYNNCLLNVFTLNTPKIVSMFEFIIDLSNKKDIFIDKAFKHKKIREIMLETFLNCVNLQNPKLQSETNFFIINKCMNSTYMLWNKEKALIKEKLKKLNNLDHDFLSNVGASIEEVGEETQQYKKISEYPNEIKILMKNAYYYLQIFKTYVFSLSYYNSFISNEIIDLLSEKLITEFIFELLPCTYFKQKFSIIILSYFYQGRDFLSKVSSNICMKIVFIILILIFQTKEKFIAEIFDKYYPEEQYVKKIEIFDNNYLKQIKLNKKKYHLKKRLIESFGKITLLYYIRYVKIPGTFLNVIKDIYKEMNQSKMELFIELCKWNLYSGNNRNNYMKFIKEMNFEEKLNSQIYFGIKNNSIMILNPIDNRSCCLSVRNPIYNISLIANNFDNKDYDDKIRVNINDSCIYFGNYNDDFEYLFKHKGQMFLSLNNENIQNKKHRSKSTLLPKYKEQNKFISYRNPSSNNKPFKYLSINNKTYPNPIKNANILFHQISNLSSQTNTNIHYLKFKSQQSKLNFLNEISLLDTMPIYFTHHIGITFLPNISDIKENDIFSYNGEITKSYISFLQQMGETISLSSITTQNINLGNKMISSDADYILTYNDTISQIIFHVSNLIKTIKKRNEIIKEDKVCIVYVDKYFTDYSTIFNDDVNMMVYILVIPISSSNFIINIKGNAKAKRMKLMERISKVFPTKFILEITNVNCYNIIRNIACEIRLFIRKYGNVLDKGKEEGLEGVDEDEKVVCKEMCGFENRMKLINEIFMKYNVHEE